MKKWSNAEVEVLNLKNTANGYIDETVPDSDKVAVTDETGKVLGWKKGWGTISQVNSEN